MTWVTGELETVCCDLCGSHRSRSVIVRADGLRVVACVDCGLQFVSPRPKAELIARLYERDYFTKQGENATIGYEHYSNEPLTGIASARLDLAAEHIAFAGTSCLEVGCATGELCALLARRGANVVGIDLASFAIEQAHARYPHLDVRVGQLESAIDANERFSAAFVYETIEHVASPRAFLRQLHERLEPDARVFLTTPNAAVAAQLGASEWLGFATSFEHLYFFTHDSLRRLAELEGFALTAWFTGGGAGRARGTAATRTVRRLLARTGLVARARGWRERFRRRAPAFRPHGIEHTLYVVLTRLAQPRAQ